MSEYKQRNLENNQSFLKERNIDYAIHNNGYQYNFDTEIGIVAFYPSTNKWVF